MGCERKGGRGGSEGKHQAQPGFGDWNLMKELGGWEGGGARVITGSNLSLGHCRWI